MGVIGTVTKTILVCYILMVVYIALSRIYLPGCNCNPTKQNCEKICVSPFWALPDTRIDMCILVGRSIADRKPVWKIQNHSISQRLSSNISFPTGITVSGTEDNLYAWVEFSVTDAAGNIPVVTVNFSIAEQRKVSFKRRQTRNLLTSFSGSSAHSDLVHDSEHALHWKYAHAPATIRNVQMYAVMDPRTYGETLATPMKMTVWSQSPATDKSMKMTRRMYEPILWLDDLAITSRHYKPVTITSTARLSLNASAEIIDTVQFEYQFIPTTVIHYFGKKMIEINMGMMKGVLNGNEEALDEIRYYLSEDRILTLILTQLIGWAHIVFEYLAFQDDWKFFRGRKNYKGVSSSSLIYSVFRSVIIFLYLHHQETSWLVLGTLGKDIMYDTWKLYKIFQPRFEWCLVVSISIPYIIRIRDISEEGDEEERLCSAYDKTASLHAGLCLYPLVTGLSMYYLKTYTYASWYSWFISSAVDCVYFFGFLSMLPQLYINFKLKSVAHLPVKSFMYKIFNTFIDDIFAFVVKSPLKHKIMTLRDDLVFFGFMYQWWIYPADKARANEFGFLYNHANSEEELAVAASSQATSTALKDDVVSDG